MCTKQFCVDCDRPLQHEPEPNWTIEKCETYHALHPEIFPAIKRVTDKLLASRVAAGKSRHLKMQWVSDSLILHPDFSDILATIPSKSNEKCLIRAEMLPFYARLLMATYSEYKHCGCEPPHKNPRGVFRLTASHCDISAAFQKANLPVSEPGKDTWDYARDYPGDGPPRLPLPQLLG